MVVSLTVDDLGRRSARREEHADDDVGVEDEDHVVSSLRRAGPLLRLWPMCTFHAV